MDLTGGLTRQTSNAGETAPPGHWIVDDRLSYGRAAFPKTVIWRTIVVR